MARKPAESHEEKRYLAMVKRGKPRKGKVDFSFDPPLPQTTPISGKTLHFIQTQIVEKGGALKTEGAGESMRIIAISIDQSAKRGTVVTLFNMLEKDGICDRHFPEDEGIQGPTPGSSTMADLLTQRGKTHTRVASTVSPKAHNTVADAEAHTGEKAGGLPGLDEDWSVIKDVRELADKLGAAAIAAIEKRKETEKKLAETEGRETALKKQFEDQERELAARKADEAKIEEEKMRKEAELKKTGEIAAQYLSYADIVKFLSDENQKRFLEHLEEVKTGKEEGNIMKYAAALQEMQKVYTPDKIDDLVLELWKQLLDLLTKMGVKMSPYGASKSWVYWDMAKQYYLKDHPHESKPEYKLGNPIEDEEIRQQIVDRQFGWEVYGKYHNDEAARTYLDGLLNASPVLSKKAGELLHMEPTNGDSLSSKKLEDLGRLLRTNLLVEAQYQKLQDFLDRHEVPDIETLKTVLANRPSVEVKDKQVMLIPKEIYEVQADIMVEKGGTLRIQAGAALKFYESGGIFCHGEIAVLGTIDELILFTALEEGKHWQNITIDGDGSNHLEFCVIEEGGGRTYVDSYKKNGGGIALINGCESTLINSAVIRKCKVNGEGGGIWNAKASPSINHVQFYENEAASGGGIYIESGKPQFIGGTLQKNKAKFNGGGLHIAKGSPYITGMSVENNSADNGGGLYMTTSPDTRPKLLNTVLTKNTAQTRGGGAYLHFDYDQTTAESYRPEIQDIEFTGNRAKEGGAAYIYHNISKWSYDFMKHPCELPGAVTTDNSPDDLKTVFRSIKA